MAQKPKHKQPGMSRELTALYLENQTIPVSLDAFQAKPKFGTKAERWVWRGFKSSARNDDLVLGHWTKANESFTDYFYARYNAKTKPCRYTDEEYTDCIAALDANWTRVETEYLLSLCEEFDLRFVVIHDRYYSHPDCPKQEVVADRTLEDLKDRYYSICRALTQHRAGQDSRDPDDLPLQATNKLADDLALLNFDKTNELERKAYLEALFSRTKEEIDEEEILITEARRIEANERRLIHEREMLLQSYSFFEDAPAGSAASTVKVQFASGIDPMTPSSSVPLSAGIGESTPKIRKSMADSVDVSGMRSVKKQKTQHPPQSAARVKLAGASNKAQHGHGSQLPGNAPSSTKVINPNTHESSAASRRSQSPARVVGTGVKEEHADSSAVILQFGTLSFATEKHLVEPAIAQVEASDGL
ncbi:swr complex subunit [Dipsacomyces acuminosporus]|nr:swr complex subunit [Dipsacomyces acuminosporus]